jgi:hypothetical protein
MGAILLAFGGSILLGQQVPKSYSYTFKKAGGGTCIFKAVTIDQVWTAAWEALALNRCVIISSDKAGGTMNAERREDLRYQYALSLFFEQVESDVRVRAAMTDLVKSGFMPRIPSAATIHRKYTIKVYDKIAELLYGKI